jgi:hypothetical protein
VSSYVYAIVRAGHRFGDEPLLGVGEPAAQVRPVTEGRLTAVVSDAPEGLRAKRRDLLAHQRVLAALDGAGPVLPMRFGSVADDDAAVRMVLHERAEHFLKRLEELDGRVEFNVKAVHHEEQVLRRIVSTDQRIRELNARTRAGASHEDKLRLGELVAGAVREQQARDAELVRGRLRPLAEAEATAPEVGDCLCNYSFLVDRAAADRFRDAAAELEKANEHLQVRVHGPLPPYSFVEPALRTA